MKLKMKSSARRSLASRLGLALLACAVSASAHEVEPVEFNPIGIPYAWGSEISAGEVAETPPDHVGAWSWDEDGFPATAKGWTKTWNDSFGNLATIVAVAGNGGEGPWLCVPTSPWVCSYRESAMYRFCRNHSSCRVRRQIRRCRLCLRWQFCRRLPCAKPMNGDDYARNAGADNAPVRDVFVSCRQF